MDKSLILREIKKHYNFKTDGEFALFLGIKQNTLSNWSTRNSIDYDRIISKCEDIDANWLLTGKGEMLRTRQELAPPIADTKDSYIIELQKDKIRSLEKELHDQRLQIEQLKKQLSSVPASTVGSKSVL